VVLPRTPALGEASNWISSGERARRAKEVHRFLHSSAVVLRSHCHSRRHWSVRAGILRAPGPAEENLLASAPLTVLSCVSLGPFKDLSIVLHVICSVLRATTSRSYRVQRSATGSHKFQSNASHAGRRMPKVVRARRTDEAVYFHVAQPIYCRLPDCRHSRSRPREFATAEGKLTRKCAVALERIASGAVSAHRTAFRTYGRLIASGSAGDPHASRRSL